MYRTCTDQLISPRPRKYLNVLLKPLIISLTSPIHEKQIIYDNTTTILHHQFKSSCVKYTNNTLQDSGCSLRCANMGYMRFLSSLQVNTDTTILQNTIVEVKLPEMTFLGLRDLDVESKIIAQRDKVSHKEDDYEELAKQELKIGTRDLFEYKSNDDNSLRKITDKQNEQKTDDSRSEDTTFEDAVAELKEIVSYSQYSYTPSKCQGDDDSLPSLVSPILIDYSNDKKEFRSEMTTSPILRAQNPIPFNKPFMNNNRYENDIFSSSFKLDQVSGSRKDNMPFKEHEFAYSRTA